MQNRWFILAVLFVVRVTMAFQFQAVAALSPLVMRHFGVGLADVGLLIGLYLAPGIAIAIPGGALGARFGDRRVVAAGLVMMICGGTLMMLDAGWHLHLLGRLIAGIGGVLLNVLMSKMVTDWFAGREIGTAMGIFVNSWPVGIALALLVLPVIARAGGLQLAFLSVTGFAVIGLLLLGAYRERTTEAGDAPATVRLVGIPLKGAIAAGSIWGLYNAALGMIFGFAPAMLTERGWTLAAASSTTSIVLWLIAISVPLGGVLADRTGRRDTVLVFGLLSFALLMVIAPSADQTVAVFMALGVVGGLAAGPIMSLPSAVLSPGNRARGMGVFFALFYLGVVAAPVFAGWLAEIFGHAGVAFPFGAIMLMASCLALMVFKRFERLAAASAAGRP
jgi:MFS family permease